MSELLYPDELSRIAGIGACFEVYKDKGCGFLEAVYQECLELEYERFILTPDRKSHYTHEKPARFRGTPKTITPLVLSLFILFVWCVSWAE